MTLASRLPLAVMPSHMAFTNDSKTVFVTLQVSGELAAIDLADAEPCKWKMKVGKVPAGLWMTPGDKYLLVGMTGADYVAVVDWRNQKIVKTIHTGNGAHNFRSLADGKHVAVSNRVGEHDQHHRRGHAHQRRRHHRSDAGTGRHGTFRRQTLSVGYVPLREARRHHRPDNA